MGGLMNFAFILGVILIISVIALVLGSLTKKTKTPIKGLDLVVMNDLFDALGGSENIQRLSAEHQRLKVTVLNIKDIDATKLKQLDIPAVIAGKEVKLLVRAHTEDALAYLSARKKEGI
ncbi:MAG: hypothetical protein EA375_01555 [Acholeplasmataceae bacterium]|nr:MAG: hypothetical protein EA375_01555 [Acholeplasmataceae bacterium]